MRVKYTKEILEEILAEGGATVLEEYPKYNQRMRVKFRCECGLETSKRFEMLNLYYLYSHNQKLMVCNPVLEYMKHCIERYFDHKKVYLLNQLQILIRVHNLNLCLM